VGLLLSSVTFLAVLPASRSFVAANVVRWIDDAIAGTLTLEGIAVLPQGGVELRGLRVADPEGRLVLRVDHARLFPDVARIADRELGIALELDGVDADAVLRTADGELAIAAAFAPARVRASKGPRQAPAAESGAGWTVRVGKLSAVHLRVRADGPEARPLELQEVALDARGLWAPGAARIEARLAGAMISPAEAPLSVELRAESRGAALRLERLAATLGDDQLEAIGEGDLARRTGRLALTRVGISQREAGSLASAVRLGGELNGTLYAESDGEIATAAFTVVPAAAEATGRAYVAFAVRLPPAALAWGVSADVDRLDPSRLSLLAPPGSVTLRGRGAARGGRLEELAGRITLRLDRSRLRKGELGPVALSATMGGGDVEISKLEASAPGGEIGGRLRWREGRAVEGALRVHFADLGRFGRNLGELVGRPLPPVEGAGHAEVALSGSSSEPRIEATVDAPRLSIAALRTAGAHLRLHLQGSEAGLTFAANVPDLGPDPVRAEVRGRFGDERRVFDLAELAVAWPGTRFTLAGGARVELAGPAVDRLVLVSGEQRIEAEGGFRAKGTLDGHLKLTGLELSRLPRGLAPEGAALEGQLTLDARASGTRVAPRVDATIGLSGATAWEVGGLSVLGDVAWDGELERIEADLGLVRARGGAVDLSFDLPVALGRARPYEEIRVELRGKAVPLDELVWLAGSYALVSGDVEFTSVLTGSVGAPVLRATAKVRDGTYEDLEALDGDGTLDAEEDRVRLRASGALAGAPAFGAEAELDLKLARFLTAPREAADSVRHAPGTLALRLPGLSLSPLAGHLDLPADLDGRLEGEAKLGGGLAAPRGTARLSVAGGAGWGARALDGQFALALAPERSGATLDLRASGRPPARVDARIDLPFERLLDRAARAAAPFQLDASLARSELSAWGGELIALGGTVEGRASVKGTLGAPTGELALSATAAVVEGRPLGALTLDAKYAGGRTTASVDLKPPAGGTLHADLALERDLGILAAPGPLLEAKTEARLVAERLDLGFLPALAPGIIRAAAGAASVELRAAGPIRELRPVGTIRLANGRLAVAELGEWTGATVEADLSEDAVELRRFEVKKGRGRLELKGRLLGLSGRAPAELEGTLLAVDFGVERAGMELVRLDLEAEGRGKVTRKELTLGLVAPQGVVTLPKRIPRTLQEVSKREDITVGRPKPARARRLPKGAAAETATVSAAAPAEEPFKTVVHFVAPRRLRVKADQPRIDVELKADAIFAFAGGRSEANGTVESVRGQVEPIGGRVFVVERGKVAFTGGSVNAGVLDIASRYDNPTAVVRATVTGTLANPRLQLSSEPPLEEAQIALLVATGRTELRAGAGGVNTLAAGDAGLAAAGAVAMGVFKDLLSDKLPVDSVSLDSTAVSAGKYLTDRIYVGYIRRFDARSENGENPDEVKIEYQLAPGWQVETRYGTAQSGGASIVWTRNY
jgi:translocation and assembly module TamB